VAELFVLVVTVDKYGLVDSVKAMGDEAHTQHEKNQADYSERKRPVHEANRPQGGVGDAKGFAVCLLFHAFQGNYPGIELKAHDNKRDHDETFDVDIQRIPPGASIRQAHEAADN
jgi:hypothetical protein